MSLDRRARNSKKNINENSKKIIKKTWQKV